MLFIIFRLVFSVTAILILLLKQRMKTAWRIWWRKSKKNTAKSRWLEKSELMAKRLFGQNKEQEANMRKLTFTIYNEDDTIYGYLFEVTGAEAQAIVRRINRLSKTYHYF